MILRALPTWVLTNAMSPFLRTGHPWKGRWFSFRDWYEHQLHGCVCFDYLLWVSVVMSMIAIAAIVKG